MKMRTLAFLCLLLAITGCATTAPENKSAEAYFKEAEEFYQNKQYEDAIAAWKRVKEAYSSPELTAQAELNIADAQFDNGNYIEASAAYEDFRKFHPKHEKAAYALYRLALCNYRQIDGIDTDQTPVKNSVVLFERFIEEYPKDPAVPEAREKLEDCRMKQLAYEIYVGRFYLRTGKYTAAMKRLREALAQFPKAPVHLDEALFYLGQASILAGDKTKGREAFDRLFTDYPNSPYITNARSFMEKNY